MIYYLEICTDGIIHYFPQNERVSVCGLAIQGVRPPGDREKCQYCLNAIEVKQRLLGTNIDGSHVYYLMEFTK